MRPLIMLVLSPLLASARVCSGSAETEATAPTAVVAVNANAAAAPVAIASKHGGTLVAVDDVQLELIVKGDGQVVAYPVQSTVSASAPPTLAADAQVTVAVPVDSGGTRPVQLVWSPVELRFVGQVQGATVVTTRPNDVEVTVVSHGRRRHRRVEHVVFVDSPGVRVVHTPPPVVRVQGPSAVVRVDAPRVDVRLNVPTVRVRVDGDYDRHHDEGRGHGHHDNGLHLGHAGGGHGGHGGMGGGRRH